MGSKKKASKKTTRKAKKASKKATKKSVRKKTRRKSKKAVSTLSQSRELMELKRRAEEAEKREKAARDAVRQERRKRREVEEAGLSNLTIGLKDFNEDEAIGFDEEDIDTGFGFGDDVLEDNTSLTGGRDVFKEAEALIKKGDFPQFGIYKNSVYEGRVHHPYSWDKVKEEYGPGHYKVQAISTNTGKIFKVESRMVGGVKEVQAAKEMEGNQSLTPPPSSNGLDVEAILNYAAQMARLQTQTKKDEEKEVRRSESSLQNTIFQTLSTQSESQNQFNKLILDTITKSISEMGKSQSEMIKMIREETKEEKRERKEELRLLLTSLKSEKPEFGFKEILQMLNSARTEGATQVKEMQDLIESKMALLKDNSGGDVDSGDWSDKFLSAAPMLLQSFLAKPQQGFQQAQPSYGEHLPAPVSPAAGGVQHTPYVPPEAVVRAPAQQTQPQQASVQHRRSQFQHETRNPQEQDGAVEAREVQTETITDRGNVTTIREGDADLGFEAQDLDEANGAEVVQNETPNLSEAEIKINALVLPTIVEKLQSGADPKLAATEILDLLNKVGLTREQVLSVYPFDRTMDLVAPYVEESMLPWVEEFYGHFESYTRDATRGHAPDHSLQSV